MRSLDPGEVIIRPSSKGADHLTVSWKVDEGIIQHIDVLELQKPNAFTLGKVLRIGNEDFEELDEILARHVQPMVSMVRDVMTHKCYRRAPITQGESLPSDTSTRDYMTGVLRSEKKGQPTRIPYYFTASRQFPGKFMLSYMPREKALHEYFTVTPDAYRFRGRMFETLPALMAWFKEHYREVPTSNIPTPMSMTHSMGSHTGSRHSSSHHGSHHSHHGSHHSSRDSHHRSSHRSESRRHQSHHGGSATPSYRDPRNDPRGTPYGSAHSAGVTPGSMQSGQPNTAALTADIFKHLASMGAVGSTPSGHTPM